MYPKHIMGTSNAALMLTESVKAPMISGTTEPPTIMVLIIPDAMGISEGSRSLTAKEKMFGNIIELKNPTDNKHHIPICGGSRKPANTRSILVAPKIPKETFAIPLPKNINKKLTKAMVKNINP